MSANGKSDAEWLLGERGEIYRMPRSGRVFQCRVWLSNERKYLRRSLKTTDRETARVRGEKLILDTHSDVASGRKIFGITLGELIDSFLEWRRGDIGTRITVGRHKTISSQCRAILRTKPSTIKVAELDPNSFYDWGQMRRQYTPSITDVTIRNETATINQIFGYAHREGYSHFSRMEFREIKISRENIGRRDIFTADEYDALVRYMRSYASKKHCPDPEELVERQKVRDYILLLSNTLMRTGELRQMTWGDVFGYQKSMDSTGKELLLVKLRVRKETSKVRVPRNIVVRGGKYLQRLKSYSKFTEPQDLLFTNKVGTHQLGSRELYHHWKNLMEGIGIDNFKERKLSYYSLRHFGITYRMSAGVPIADVAHIAGTSSSHIESHYRHVKDDVMIRAAQMNFSRSEEGQFEL